MDLVVWGLRAVTLSFHSESPFDNNVMVPIVRIHPVRVPILDRVHYILLLHGFPLELGIEKM